MCVGLSQGIATLQDAYFPLPERYRSVPARRTNSILLQSSRCDEENYRSYLFIDPVEILTSEKLEDLPKLFAQIESALRGGNFVSGFFSYECGEHFERISRATLIAPGTPLAWFGVYRSPYIFNHRRGRFEGDPPKELTEAWVEDQGFELSNVRLGTTKDTYSSKVEAIHECIRTGETYQINLTDKLKFDFSGSPGALFAALSARQPVPYSAFIHLGDRHILSSSPELFFRIREGRITTRPMKGTASRGRTLGQDERIAAWLKSDPKNRAENVMIVDLLRNDIGRLCEFGSVRVDDLFSIEKYETLFQMTSTVSGTLRPGTSLYDIFKGVFPCGSVTGAPKIRSMSIIRQLEQQPRGVYSGAIGFFSPNGEAVFNVAIRTILLRGHEGEMGVGSGITIDSVAEDEYRECLLKAEFLSGAGSAFELIESLLWDEEYRWLASHLKRMEDSACYFGFAFDRPKAEELLHSNALTLSTGIPTKVRLALDHLGGMTIQNTPLNEATSTGRVMVSSVRTSSADRFLYHKTTRRQLYSQTLERALQEGYDDVLFLNERDEVTEGAISNVFAEIGGRLVTPPVNCGLLAGIYREHLLEKNPLATEGVLTLGDLLGADAVYICNSVRGMRKVTVVQPQVG
jgi:para-aminobenzoate synthetase/4-amino-4-deoxychorismate lyase